jgi:hypothetical protein
VDGPLSKTNDEQVMQKRQGLNGKAFDKAYTDSDLTNSQKLRRRLEYANSTRNYHQGLPGSLLNCKNQQSGRLLS